MNSYSDHMPRAHGIKKINLKGYKYAYDRIIFNNDKEKILHNSRITLNGNLTPRFRYLIDYIND